MDVSEEIMYKLEQEKVPIKISRRQLILVLMGNILIGVGVAVLRVSQMGNDAYSAMNMSISEALAIII